MAGCGVAGLCGLKRRRRTKKQTLREKKRGRSRSPPLAERSACTGPSPERVTGHTRARDCVRLPPHGDARNTHMGACASRPPHRAPGRTASKAANGDDAAKGVCGWGFVGRGRERGRRRGRRARTHVAHDACTLSHSPHSRRPLPPAHHPRLRAVRGRRLLRRPLRRRHDGRERGRVPHPWFARRRRAAVHPPRRRAVRRAGLRERAGRAPVVPGGRRWIQ